MAMMLTAPWQLVRLPNHNVVRKQFKNTGKITSGVALVSDFDDVEG